MEGAEDSTKSVDFTVDAQGTNLGYDRRKSSEARVKTSLSSMPIWENAVSGPPPKEAPDVTDDHPQTKQNIMHILATKRERRRRTFQEITKREKRFWVLPANGSVKSIMDWATKPN